MVAEPALRIVIVVPEMLITSVPDVIEYVNAPLLGDEGCITLNEPVPKVLESLKTPKDGATATAPDVATTF